jgi:hypothetical protein
MAAGFGGGVRLTLILYFANTSHSGGLALALGGRCAEGTRAPNTHTACPLPQQLAHCHTARQRHTAHQRYTACPLSYSLPTITQLAPLPHSLPATTELASCHRACQRYTACQLPHSSLMVYGSPTVYRSPTATQLASCHRACQRYTGYQRPHSGMLSSRLRSDPTGPPTPRSWTGLWMLASSFWVARF